MKSRLVIGWMMLLVAAAFAYGGFTLWRIKSQYDATPHNPPVDYHAIAKELNLGPGEFVLTDHNGELFSSRKLRGKVWALTFFFTNCPNECLRINSSIVRLQRELADADVTFVSVSCSPEFDQPEVLKEYAARIHANLRKWVFLTGDFVYIKKQIADPVRLNYARSDHSPKGAVIGKDGLVRGYFNLDDAAERKKLQALLPQLAAEPAPPEEAVMKNSASVEQKGSGFIGGNDAAK